MYEYCRSRVAPAEPKELYPSEQIVLGATRLWVARHRRGAQPEPVLNRFFAFWDAEAAAISHHTLMRHSALAANRAIAIHDVECGCLSKDEERLAHAVAFAQRRWTKEAARMLEVWLPPAAVRLDPAGPVGPGAGARRTLLLPPHARLGCGRRRAGGRPLVADRGHAHQCAGALRGWGPGGRADMAACLPGRFWGRPPACFPGRSRPWAG